jgi:hypothetical protein
LLSFRLLLLLLLVLLVLLLLLCVGLVKQCSSCGFHVKQQQPLDGQECCLAAMHLSIRTVWHRHHHNMLVTCGHSCCHLQQQG